MDKQCSGQGNLDADDADTANESNRYMSPFQATQKQRTGTRPGYTVGCLRETTYLQLPLGADNPVPLQYCPPVHGTQELEFICCVLGLKVPMEQGYSLADVVFSGQ